MGTEPKERVPLWESLKSIARGPLEVLPVAVRAVPAVKYALGIVGIAGCAATVLGYFQNPQLAIYSLVAGLVIMVMLVIFSRVARLAAGSMKLPAIVFTWRCLALFVLWACALTSSALFGWPPVFSHEGGETAHVEDGGFVISGEIVPEFGSSTPSRPSVTILWGADRGDGDTLFQSARVSQIDPTTGKLAYALTLSAPPPHEVLMPGGASWLGVGFITVFDDANGNGILDGPEAVVGMSATHAVTFLHGSIDDFEKAARDREPDTDRPILTLRKLPQGYALTRAVPPETHRLPVPFDDLLPISAEPVNIVLPKDRRKITGPNWT